MVKIKQNRKVVLTLIFVHFMKFVPKRVKYWTEQVEFTFEILKKENQKTKVNEFCVISILITVGESRIRLSYTNISMFQPTKVCSMSVLYDKRKKEQQLRWWNSAFRYELLASLWTIKLTWLVSPMSFIHEVEWENCVSIMFFSFTYYIYLVSINVLAWGACYNFVQLNSQW